ncbi:hypothetical protein F5Y16DRAFT_372774 [Xylariaceae sp. FL0255]|nr:hypothetical protein F5Y16DRAFT_372774 [Xylariaceae sp. FL0255]
MAPTNPFLGGDWAARLLKRTSQKDASPPPTRPKIAIVAINANAATPVIHDALTTTITTVPQIYGNHPNGPDPGTVVGITLGSVFGFLFLLGIIYWCLNLGQGPRVIEEGSVGGGGGSSSVVSRHSRPRPHHNKRRRRSKRRETVEIRRETTRRPVNVDREEQIVVEEYGSRGPAPRSRSRSMAGRRESPLPPRMVPMSDTTGESDHEIVVEEEQSTPPRRRRDSMRSQRTRRSEDRRSAVYRDDVYVRDVSRRRSSSRR